MDEITNGMILSVSGDSVGKYSVTIYHKELRAAQGTMSGVVFIFEENHNVTPQKQHYQLAAGGTYNLSQEKSIALKGRLFTNPHGAYSGELSASFLLTGSGTSAAPGHLMAYSILPRTRAKAGVNETFVIFNGKRIGDLGAEEASASGTVDMDIKIWAGDIRKQDKDGFRCPGDFAGSLNTRTYIEGRGFSKMTNGSSVNADTYDFDVFFHEPYEIKN